MTNEEMNEYGSSLNQLLDMTLLDVMQAKKAANKEDADDDTKQAWQLIKTVLKVEDVPDMSDVYTAFKKFQNTGFKDNSLGALFEGLAGENNE